MLSRWSPRATALVGALVAAATVAACGSGGGGDKGAPPLTPPPGFTVVSDAKSGFAIAVPDDWVRLPLNGLAAYDAAVERIQAQNPATKDALDTGRTLIGRGVKLFALDPADNGATTVNLVVIDDVDDESLEIASRQAIDRLTERGATNVDRRFTTLGGVEAVKATFTVPVQTATGIRQVETTQYYLLQDGTSYVLTLAGTGPDRDAIVETLRIA